MPALGWVCCSASVRQPGVGAGPWPPAELGGAGRGGAGLGRSSGQFRFRLVLGASGWNTLVFPLDLRSQPCETLLPISRPVGGTGACWGVAGVYSPHPICHTCPQPSKASAISPLPLARGMAAASSHSHPARAGLHFFASSALRQVKRYNLYVSGGSWVWHWEQW